jgi:hypothetical protein
MSRAKHWCFTLNNWTHAEQAAILSLGPALDNPTAVCDYVIIGREVGSNSTPHLQGFLSLRARLRLANVKALPGLGRAHLEVARGTPHQAATYCKKDGDFDERGECPSSKGKRTDFESLKEWIKEQDPAPTHRDLAENFPSLWGRYQRACIGFLEMFGRKPTLVEGPLRPWQRDLDERVRQEPDDRSVFFVVDPEGNKGKSWMTRYWYTSRDDIQRFAIGKREDLAYAIDVSKKLFVFDIPRGQLELLQYSILEQLKDRMIFSSKYESCSKVLPHKCHVVVFTNEEPDRSKMTRDRFKILRITNI